MKIPTPVNSLWDRAERDPALAAIVAVTVLALAAAIGAASVLTTAGKYVLCAVDGFLIGGVAVGLAVYAAMRTAATTRRVKLAEALAENENLRQDELPPVDTSASAETARIWAVGGDR